MKRYLLLLLLLPAISLYTEEKPFVEIYKTHDNGLYGRSEDRDMVLSIKKSIFKRHKTLKANKDLDFLTAVVIDTKIVNELERRFKNRNYCQIGFIRITKDNGIYSVEDDNLLLSFSFSYEKPSDNVIGIIENHYPRTSKYRKIVSDHYKENYIIRIHSAENIILPEAQEITYDEALIMATIIGDEDQWLWGIHDGRNYLEELLFK